MQQDKDNLEGGSGTMGDPYRPKGIETWDDSTKALPMPRVRGLAAVQADAAEKGRLVSEAGQKAIWDALSGEGPRHPTAHEIIAQRGPVHGDFDDNATLSQQLKDTIRSFQRKDGSYPWHELSPAMKEALDMDCLKTSRAVTGRADFRDHWADKAGYATLVADRCPD